MQPGEGLTSPNRTKLVIDWAFSYLGGVTQTVHQDVEAGDSVAVNDDGNYIVEFRDGENAVKETYFMLARNLLFVTFRKRQEEVLDPKQTPVAQHVAKLERQQPKARPPLPA